MTNEEKAKDITKCLWFPQDCTEGDIQNMLVEMAQWKDEQFLQWLKENLAKETFTMFTSESQDVINFEPIIKAFEKFIKQ